METLMQDHLTILKETVELIIQAAVLVTITREE